MENFIKLCCTILIIISISSIISHQIEKIEKKSICNTHIEEIRNNIKRKIINDNWCDWITIAKDDWLITMDYNYLNTLINK